MNRLPVLIVGAGPTGLMLACELARRDIEFRIIDKKSEPTQGSNATWIQTRSLEMLDALGIAGDFLRIGHSCDAVHFYAKGKEVAALPLNQIDSAYPHILMLPQRETERLLTNKLAQAKIDVERTLELIDIQQSEAGVVSTVRLANGEIEKINSDYVVACDGANSAVRTQCQFSFPGNDIPEQFMVADARMSSFLSPHQIHVFYDHGTIFPERGTIFSAFPWGNKEYRLSANLYLSHPRQSFTETEVKDIVAERTYGNYVVENVAWISPFWIRSRIVDSMQNSAIFLAGDAAHLHSPVGGQGMNTGLQDAYNLAWKLALVIQNKAQRALLDTYQAERYATMIKTVTETERFTHLFLFDKSFATKLKNFGKSMQDAKTVKSAAMELTQLAIQYQASPIIDDQHKVPAGTPQQGERVPDLKLKNGKTVYSYLQHTQHHILIFIAGEAVQLHMDKIAKLQAMLNTQFADLVRTLVISQKNIMGVGNVLVDETGDLAAFFGVTHTAIYVVRPDNYIAYYSADIDPAAIGAFLHIFLKA